MKLRFLFAFLLLTKISFSQTVVQFELVYDSVVFAPHRLNENDSLSKLKFYISHLKLKVKDKQIFVPKQQHCLVDFQRDSAASRLILINTIEEKNVQEIEFTLGVDSKTSAEGIGEGALDPVNGMYWTWQSGYINFKMEGVSENSPARKNQFQLHLGGFRKPHVSAQKIKLSVENPSSKIKICFDLKIFMDSIDLKGQHTIMSPSKETVSLSKLAQSCFYVK